MVFLYQRGDSQTAITQNLACLLMVCSVLKIFQETGTGRQKKEVSGISTW